MTRTPADLSPEDIAAVRSWVIHEDPHVIAFNKPSGLSSQGGRIQAHTLDDLLWAFARSNGKRPELVHRLDRDTSGVILAAKTKPAAGFLGKAMDILYAKVAPGVDVRRDVLERMGFAPLIPAEPRRMDLSLFEDTAACAEPA